MINNNPRTESCTTQTLEETITIGIAVTPAEKKEIYHFRYQIYVEEMSKHVEGVDYANQLLYDDLDKWTFLLYAKIGSVLIATARINIGSLTNFPRTVIEFLSLDTFQFCNTENGDHKIAYITKLMVIPSHRSSPALYLLIARCYELCCCNQVQFVFGACNHYLLRLYEQMGFHRYSKNFADPGYGLLAPIVFALNDIQHLRMIRSPLFRLARKRETVNTQAVEWFHTRFIQHSPIVNSQLVTEEKLWSILCTRLAALPTEAIPILHDLPTAAAKKFLHRCGIFVQCDSGDSITNQGDISYACNILISGRLKSVTFQHPVKEYTLPGQHFGANGLTEHNKHTEDIVAMGSAEIVVLSGMAFQKFFHSYPDIAHNIIQNIALLTKK